MMNRVYLIRHGATAGNLEKRYIGRADEPLCPEGIVQAERLGAQRLTADRLFVSPALRARQTAQLVFPAREPVVVDDLREADFGVFEGKTAAELEDDPAYRRWVDSWCLDPIPGGEDVGGFKARCCAAFGRCMAGLPEGATAAFVIHGGGIMAILEGYAGPPGSFYRYHVANCACVQCVYEAGRLRVTGGL